MTVRKITTHPWEPTVQGRAGGGRGWGAEPGVRVELRARTPSPVQLWSCCRVDAYGVRVSYTCPFTRQWPAEFCTLFYGLAYETVPCQELRPQPGHHHPTDKPGAWTQCLHVRGTLFFSCCLNSPHVTATLDILEQMSPAHTRTTESAVEVPGYVSF